MVNCGGSEMSICPKSTVRVHIIQTSSTLDHHKAGIGSTYIIIMILRTFLITNRVPFFFVCGITVL